MCLRYWRDLGVSTGLGVRAAGQWDPTLQEGDTKQKRIPEVCPGGWTCVWMLLRISRLKSKWDSRIGSNTADRRLSTRGHSVMVVTNAINQKVVGINRVAVPGRNE